MKKILILISVLITETQTIVAAPNFEKAIMHKNEAKIDVKLKNDLDDEITVINDGSGGTYRLQKNTTTTIKMEAGDKLYIYIKGKKGKLLLTAATDMDGKLQLLSKF